MKLLTDDCGTVAGNEENTHLFAALQELALNLHWSWSHETDEIWKKLDPLLWDLTHNPLVVLQTVARDKISEMLKDNVLRARIDEFIEAKRARADAPAWFQRNHPQSPLKTVAYFSMEFMLSEALPIYSGGLGNVAGDHLKSCSDLGVPVTGVGLLYQQGYSRQVLYPDGRQQNFYPFNEPGQLPVTALRQKNGEWLRVEIHLPGCSLWLRCWQVQVGNVNLYLLDSNDTANMPAHRCITSELYAGGEEIRLMQQLVLGIGGWKLLKALNISPEVCHINEGHCVFALLERIQDFMVLYNQSFEVALQATRAGNIFSTHTAVGGGFDSFSPALISKYLGVYIEERLRIKLHDFLALGRINSQDETERFNTAHLAIRLSGAVNAVSKMHAAVSRRFFAAVFPRWPLEEVPVGYVTNGVHMPTWDSPMADALWTEVCGKDRWLDVVSDMGAKIRQIESLKIWEMRKKSRERLIQYIRKRYTRQLAINAMPHQIVERAKRLFDPAVLTLGFARRFVAYKRPCLLLKDPARLARILKNPAYPVQLVIAGKAHPGDVAGQALITEWISFIECFALQDHVVFLSDYDMILTEYLVQGIDVWFNTPLKPWEACGTSGMKVLVNGGLNVSVLDGWWYEGYKPEVGWAIPDVNDGISLEETNSLQAQCIYRLLEEEIVPEYYSSSGNEIPNQWIDRIRESMASLTPYFSANRSLREYTENFYLPATINYNSRIADGAEEAIRMANWKDDFQKRWQHLSFENLIVCQQNESYEFRTTIFLNGITPEEVFVQLFAEGTGATNYEIHQMIPVVASLSPSLGVAFAATIPVTRNAGDYTVRIIPDKKGIVLPLECNCIAWQK